MRSHSAPRTSDGELRGLEQALDTDTYWERHDLRARRDPYESPATIGIRISAGYTLLRGIGDVSRIEAEECGFDPSRYEFA